jgi:hypothetical protein
MKCERCGEVNPAEIHTCTPKREWQGLTGEEIGDIIEASQITLKNYCSEDKQTEFARAIEAKLRRKNEQPCLF